jgi:1-acyl-sn-glycerol-3-phosphate acyltransferase
VNEQYPQNSKFGEPPARPSLFGYLRAVLRLTGALAFSIACAGLGWLVYPAVWVMPRKARAIRHGLSRRWMRGVLWFTGTRVVVQGPPPKPPYLIVFNHPCWLDFFALTSVLPDARFVAEAPLKTAPIIGILFRGLHPLFVKRTQEDTARITGAIADALRAGDSVAFAPETPVMDQPRGTVVRQFRAALFEAAIQTGTPVSCASLSYRTPAGCPPAFSTVIFHTAPIYRAPGSDISDAQLEAYGADKIKDFFRYIVGMLALPYHETVATFAETPVSAEDRITLANRAHETVSAIFTPVQ